MAVSTDEDRIAKLAREMSESVTSVFIRANITSACLPMAAMLQDLLRRRGIESTVREGWLIRGHESWTEPFIAARHYWVDADRLSLDPASDQIDKLIGPTESSVLSTAIMEAMMKSALSDPILDPSKRAFIEAAFTSRPLVERYVHIEGDLPEEYVPLREKMRRRVPKEMEEERETERLYRVYLSDPARFWAAAPPHIRNIFANLIRRWTR